MKPTTLLVVALFVLMAVIYFGRERFQPEFLDKSQVDRTVATETSSYEQYTNHMNPAPVSIGPLHGMQTPFQVNQYKSYIPV
jgi:hypothetical protein